ncbi:hypothetical protein [Roseateles terrae]|uniref:YscD cytoplasmic domain-containing protein n=1 Tax=Roseateles terrae TaxID=431060 RepID=A0ABR6GQQ1_9BURK|nr:hypothetical protein [Roseateles terrae]MBB3194445.1 hypothetical protein [Roseateles terrae]OWQ88271.1 hypothetical protein CDN98_09115 [Roseateles terrae]
METLDDSEVAVLDHDPPSDLALELRVLTGLQAGAALPFDQSLLVGRADDCDLLLLDDRAPPHLLEITPGEGGEFILTPMHDGLMMADGIALTDPVSLRPGEAFGIDGLWLEVQASEAPWAPTSELAGHALTPQEAVEGDRWPADNDAAPASSPDGDFPLGEPDAATRHGESGDAVIPRPDPRARAASDTRDGAVDFGDWMKDADEDDSPWRVDPSERRAPKSPTLDSRTIARRQRWKTWGVMGVGALLTLSGLAAMAVQLGIGKGRLEPSSDASSPGNVTLAATELTDSVGASITATMDAPTAAATAPPSAAAIAAPFASPSSADLNAPTASPEAGSPADLVPGLPGDRSARAPGPAQAVGARAATAPAPDTLSVPPERPGRVRVTGGVTIVRADTDIVLPFEVREVVLGARSRVILSTGQTLLPGDAVGRWRLMDIKPGILVFEGPQRVLLPW